MNGTGTQYETGRSPPHPPASEDPAGASIEASLRALVREELDGARRTAARPPPEPGRPSVLQAIVLLLLALDLVLLFVLFEDEMAERGGANVERIISVGKMLVPTVVGAAFLAYWEDLRGSVLQLCTRPLFGVAVAGLFVVLALQQLPFPALAVPIAAEPATVRVTVNGVPMNPDPRRSRVLVPGLRTHTISVEDELDGQPVADTFRLGRLRIVRAVAGRLPLVGGLLGSGPVRLQPTYPVLVSMGDEGGVLWVEVDSDEVPGLFAEREARGRDAPLEEGGTFRLWWRFPGGVSEPIRLPPATYDFLYVEDATGRTCTLRDTPVERALVTMVDFTSAAASCRQEDPS